MKVSSLLGKYNWYVRRGEYLSSVSSQSIDPEWRNPNYDPQELLDSWLKDANHEMPDSIYLETFVKKGRSVVRQIVKEYPVNKETGLVWGQSVQEVAAELEYNRTITDNFFNQQKNPH